jgi:hypothetical protein
MSNLANSGIQRLPTPSLLAIELGLQVTSLANPKREQVCSLLHTQPPEQGAMVQIGGAFHGWAASLRK